MVKESVFRAIHDILNTPPAIWAISSFSSLVFVLFGGWTHLLTTLAAAIVLDYITGVIRAGYEGKLDSCIGRQGIIKKVSFLIMVIVGHFADVLFFKGATHFFRDMTTALLLSNEILSMLENLGAMGVPIPTKLKEAINLFTGGEKCKKD